MPRTRCGFSARTASASTPPARAETSYEHPDATPGSYEVVLQMWKYVDYKKDKEGSFTNSKFIDISNRVSYTI